MNIHNEPFATFFIDEVRSTIWSSQKKGVIRKDEKVAEDLVRSGVDPDLVKAVFSPYKNDRVTQFTLGQIEYLFEMLGLSICDIDIPDQEGNSSYRDYLEYWGDY